MYIIGERINGMFVNVKEAIRNRDPKVIQDLALAQMAAGASALDVNVGPAVSDAKGAMIWLVETIREVTDAPLSIDTAKWDVMSTVIPMVTGEKIINSSKADAEIAARNVALAVDTGAAMIGLTIDANGVPGNVAGRVELGAQVITIAMEGGLDMSKLYIDPIILPVNVAPTIPNQCMQAMSQIRMFADPAPHLMLGLSNLSQKCTNRHLINRTYLAMAIAHGLDGVILDPLDRELMEVVATAELLMGKSIYCDAFLEAALNRQTVQ
jgi:5-methyltetrahydrofolate corrinoid/iron sulfur protein methyltransferase